MLCLACGPFFVIVLMTLYLLLQGAIDDRDSIRDVKILSTTIIHRTKKNLKTV